mgnify:CR=1 FL=1
MQREELKRMLLFVQPLMHYSYLLFISFSRWELRAVALAWVELFACVSLGVVIKPILVHLIVEYDYKEIMLMIGQCGLATLLACIFPVASFKILDPNSVIGFFGHRLNVYDFSWTGYLVYRT